MGLTLLLVLQALATAAAFAFLWRRQSRLSGEIARLKTELEAAQAQAGQRRARRAELAAAPAPASDAVVVHVSNARARAAQAWGVDTDETPEVEPIYDGPTLSPETGRGLALALMAAAPSLGFFFGAATPAIITMGLSIAAAMMAISLRPMWRVAAWASVLTAGAWASLGFALRSAEAEPIGYAVLLTIVAASGLLHAHLRRAAPGVTLALAMCAAALALGSEIGMVSAAGIAFGLIVAFAAIVGALTLRLEGVLLASFGAALIGLFVLSGQHEASVWFTPAAAWAGALYLAIAFIRAPQLGMRGATIAGIGALAPFAAIAALYGAQHGLADRYAAAGAFAALSALLAGIVGLTATRHDRGFARMHLTLWVLSVGAFASSACAILLAASAPIATPAFAALGLALLALNTRLPNAAWQTAAAAAALIAAIMAVLCARLVLSEALLWPAWSVVAAAYGLGALVAAAGAYFAASAQARSCTALFEALTLLLVTIGSSLAIRLFFTGGATLLQPVSFPEAGAHAAAWLLISLVAATQAESGARGVRAGAANLLGLLALLVAAGSALMWTIGFWDARTSGAAGMWTRETLGFALPAIFFWAHWVFWRSHGAGIQTRLALASGALLTAAFVTLEMVRVESAPDWAVGIVGATSFALALGINFAPGVTLTQPAAR
ncbi:MAG: hypothetical protein AB7O98_19395 [Hyphomonadaceae bacterium]